MIKEAQVQREIRRLKKIAKIIDFIVFVCLLLGAVTIGMHIGIKYEKDRIEPVLEECAFVVDTVHEYCLNSTEVRVL